jgi:hypothetical protein
MHMGVALCLFLPSLAYAQAGQEMPHASEYKSRWQADFGVASAVGEIGASYTYAPVPEIELEVGAGLGGTGYQLSAMPKLSLGSRAYRFVAGAGLSTSLDSSENPNRSYAGYWMNAEVGYEYRSPSGYSVLVAVGITYGLGGDRRGRCFVACAPSPTTPDQAVAGELYPQGRVAIGRWF